MVRGFILDTNEVKYLRCVFMVETISQYQEEVNKIMHHSFKITDATVNPWFRGQSDESWDLLPKLYREKGLEKYERELLRDFKLYSHPYLNNKIPDNDFEWLFLMQHYGIPTRLLDWTESSLIALFFSLINYKSDCNSAVWLFHPWTLNENILGDRKSVITYEDPFLSSYLLDDCNNINRSISADYPIALRPKRNSPRIISQKGMFTIHGSRKIPLNKLYFDYNSKESRKTKILIKKIIISKSYKLSIFKELYSSGITESVLFPEITGLCNELTFRYSNSFYEKI